MSAMPQEQATEQVVGTINSVQTHRSGNKWIVVVAPDGSQFTKNLWTSDQMVAAQLSQMIGQRMAFSCNRSNPYANAQGQMVSSLWIAVAGGAAAQQQVQQQPVQPQQPVMPMQQATTAMPQMPQLPAMPQPVQAQMPTGPMPVATTMPAGPNAAEKELRIMREAAAKVAGILISHVPAEQRTLDNVIALSERLVAYFERGVPRQDGNQPQQQNPQPVQQQMPMPNPAGYENPNEYGPQGGDAWAGYGEQQNPDDDIPF